MVEIKLKNGEVIVLSDKDAMEVEKQRGAHQEMINIPGQRMSVQRYSIQSIRQLVPRKCSSCGDDVYEHLPHYCNATRLNGALDSNNEDTEAVRSGIKEYRRLCKQGMKNRDAFRQVWNKDIPAFCWTERLDIERGVARICHNKDGKEYVGYDPEKLTAYYRSRNIGPASVPYTSLPKYEDKGVQEKWYNKV